MATIPELDTSNKQRRIQEEDDTMNSDKLCWCKLRLSNNEILGPTLLDINRSPVFIDRIKVLVKQKFGNKLKDIDAAELEVYAATDTNAETPLKSYDVWNDKTHGGQNGTNPMIVKAPTTATAYDQEQESSKLEDTVADPDADRSDPHDHFAEPRQSKYYGLLRETAGAVQRADGTCNSAVENLNQSSEKALSSSHGSKLVQRALKFKRLHGQSCLRSKAGEKNEIQETMKQPTEPEDDAGSPTQPVVGLIDLTGPEETEEEDELDEPEESTGQQCSSISSHERSNDKTKWTEKELYLLMEAVSMYGERNHSVLQKIVETRTTAAIRNKLSRLRNGKETIWKQRFQCAMEEYIVEQH